MIRAALLCCCLAAPVFAAGPADVAREAMAQLNAAAAQLDAASGARDRVRALTETVKAFETGLAAMRDGLRTASIRETELRRELASRDEEISRLLAALATVGPEPNPQSLLHPQGPVGSARAGMLLAALAPALRDAASDLRHDLQEASDLRQLQQDAVNTLRDGLRGVQEARTALSKAVADRTDLPRKFTEDPVKTALLIAASETLDGFASGLSQISENEQPLQLPSIEARKGQIPLPVAGTILRKPGEADAAGVRRPGIVVATRPQALVTTPVAATLRFAGPLLDYGLVAILEPHPDIMFVLAGLGTVFGTPGEVLPAGSPVGLMAGDKTSEGEFLSPSGEQGGGDFSESLYIEVREGDAPVDPLAWFAKDRG